MIVYNHLLYLQREHMKKTLTIMALTAAVVTTPLLADEYSFHTKSLFALEGGYSKIKGDVFNGSTQLYDLGKKSDGIGSYGLKIGAQSENYRVFLSARHYDTSGNLDRLNTYGGELQYLFNFHKKANFFIGANGGIADIRIGAQTTGSTFPAAKKQTPYYGVDAGFNVHASELIDVELGYRYSKIKDNITQGNYTYSVDNLSAFYGSVIIKWEMD